MATITPQNPASPSPVEALKADTRVRVPMSVPRRKLQTPDLPGYHTHWFLEENIFLAQQAFYEFVKIDEMPVNQFGPATGAGMSGSLDMGNNVCVVGNKIGALGKPEMQYLMKLKIEYWNEDQQKLEAINAAKLGPVFRGEQIAGEDGLSYVDKDKTSKLALYQRPVRRGRG